MNYGRKLIEWLIRLIDPIGWDIDNYTNYEKLKEEIWEVLDSKR